jgi:ABC-type multidrug transport system fused ATPase/permease subunit
MQIIKKLLYLLTPTEQKRAKLLLLMILVMALLDMLGVVSIMPFMALLATPDLVEVNEIFKFAYAALNGFGIIGTTKQFLFALGVFVFVMLVISLAFKAFTTYALLRYTLMLEYSIGKRLVEGYLHQPYIWFLNQHSADLGKTILSEVSEVIHQGAIPMMNLIAQAFVATGLITILILVDPKLALIAGIMLTIVYALLYKFTRGLLNHIGKERLIANQARFTAISEAFGAFKEVKVGGFEQVYIQRFSDPARTFARHQATATAIAQLPRFALEAILFGAMLLVVLYLMSQSDSFTSNVPIITLYAFAGYRLIPALQQIYGAVTQLRFSGPALKALHDSLNSLQPKCSNPRQNSIVFKQAITLNQIQYRYPNAPQLALKNLSLTIHAKSTVGFVGASGSGKSTVVDLILGLLEAQEGVFTVDGQTITERNRRAWQRVIGYVPQHIYLSDDTVASNIAFGVNAKDIDQAAVEHAAKIANLHDFVINELTNQYQTIVGERGLRLSGGQRQRIGIARALYHKPQVLVLDEATSALDNLTEQVVMEAIHKLGHELTIILIAHRMSTVKACDTIFHIENGAIKAQGTFEELMQTNERFRAMADIK